MVNITKSEMSRINDILIGLNSIKECEMLERIFIKFNEQAEKCLEKEEQSLWDEYIIEVQDKIYEFVDNLDATIERLQEIYDLINE